MIIIQITQHMNHQISKPYLVAHNRQIIGMYNTLTMEISSIRFT